MVISYLLKSAPWTGTMYGQPLRYIAAAYSWMICRNLSNFFTAFPSRNITSPKPPSPSTIFFPMFLFVNGYNWQWNIWEGIYNYGRIRNEEDDIKSYLLTRSCYFAIFEHG